MRSRLAAPIAAALLVLGTAACGANHSPNGGSGASPQSSLAGIRVSGAFDTQPNVKIRTPLKVKSPKTRVIKAGTGNPVVANQTAMFNVYVANGRTGKKAVSTYDAGTPLQKQMSSTQFFAPIVKAMVGKKQGSRIEYVAPTKDLWGAKGEAQIGLKPNDPSVWVIDVISVQPKNVLKGPQGTKVAAPSNAPKVVEKSGKVTGLDFSSAPKKPPTKLQVIPLVKGGGPKVKSGTLVTFNYFGVVWGKSKPFDSSFSRGAPTPFGIGVHGLIPGWDKTIPGLTRGSRVLIIVPPKDGYGSQAQRNIPANSTLVFVVDVLGVDS